MKTRKLKTRTVTIKVFVVETRKSWRNAELVFIDASNDCQKKVVIKIDGPADLSYIRDYLDAIENDWRERLGVASK